MISMGHESCRGSLNVNIVQPSSRLLLTPRILWKAFEIAPRQLPSRLGSKPAWNKITIRMERKWKKKVRVIPRCVTIHCLASEFANLQVCNHLIRSCNPIMISSCHLRWVRQAEATNEFGRHLNYASLPQARAHLWTCILRLRLPFLNACQRIRPYFPGLLVTHKS